MHEVYSAGRSIFALEFSLDELLGNATNRTRIFRWLDFCLESIAFHNLHAPVVLVGTGGGETDDFEKKNSNLVETHHMVGKRIAKMAVYKENKLHLHLPPQRLFPPVCVCASVF